MKRLTPWKPGLVVVNEHNKDLLYRLLLAALDVKISLMATDAVEAVKGAKS